ncbi:hypothetical protein [Sulfolobus acidocaldarius]|uniref:hypothetical protein n=1 Tax=Sulfolobus acidocaldarius TaxID=2285 RepID=UPI000783E9B7|nr:hypothetical protein [Sulfolobus acidocaldarius]
MWKEEIREEHSIILKATKSLLYSYALSLLYKDQKYLDFILDFYQDFYENFVINCHNKKEEKISSLVNFDDTVRDHAEIRKIALRAFTDTDRIGEFSIVMINHVVEEENKWLSNVNGRSSAASDVYKRQELYNDITTKFPILDILQVTPTMNKLVVITRFPPEKIFKLRLKAKIGNELWVAEV